MSTKIGKDYSLIVILIPIIALALILDTYGLGWGLPDKQHFHHSFHPDETASLLSSLEILLSPRTLYPSPTALGNGSMQFYIVAIVYQITHGSNLKSIVKNLTAAKINNLYSLGRIVTIAFSIGAAIVLFLIAQRTFGKFCAAIATLMFVSMPAIVVNTHYFRPDIPATFWILLSFLMSISIFKSGKLRFYILSGIFAGFAVSTKYNSVLIFLPLLCAHVMRIYHATKSTAFKEYFNINIILAALVGIGAFFIGSPGTVIYWDEFRQRLSQQRFYQTEAIFLESVHRGPRWIGYFIRILPYSLGLPLLIVAFLGMVYVLWSRKKIAIMLLSWCIPYYLLLGSSNWWVVRYTVPLMPFLAIFGARILTDSFMKMKGIFKFVVAIVGVVTIVFTMVYSLKLDGIMAAEDPRIMAYDWINKKIEPGKAIGADFLPAAFYPCINTQRYKAFTMKMDRMKLDLIDYYVANDQIYLQYLRLHKRYPSEARYFRDIFYSKNFKKIAVFENSFDLWGLKFNKVDIPHDYLYFMPTITIYKKTEKLLNGDEFKKN